MKQSTNNIFLVKPARFGYNVETAESNGFQNKSLDTPLEITKKAIAEFNEMAKKLSAKGINVLIIDDTPNPVKPDAIFPNNWGSFHADGRVVLYPMLAENRREERRNDILELIATKYEISEIIDLSHKENSHIFLEGTGSIIFDHPYKLAYACLSPRTDQTLLIETCNTLGYQPIYFNSFDVEGKAIYHTNVMMNIGNGYAVVCLESIADIDERQMVVHSLKNSGKEIIEISFEQMHHFCGNMLELDLQQDKNVLVLSQRAHNHLTSIQINQLENYCALFPLNIETIEQIGGGSVRCMISEIHLPEKEVVNVTSK